MARPISFCLLAFAFLVFMNAVVASARSSLRTTRGPHQEPSYLKFVSNATDFPSEDYYDYIIIGGGTAGCGLAATLSSRFRVLLLERGSVPCVNEDGFLAALLDVNSFDSPTQAFTSEDGVPNVRGRILGGSSAINAGFYSRTDQEFYKRSSFNWDLKVVKESYEWAERAFVISSELRNWQSAVRHGLLEAGLDHVLGTKTGGSTFDTLGRRHSAADLLKYAQPLNIRVAVHATVERVLLASSTASPVPRQSAIGVVFCDQNGSAHHAMLQKHGEVLLSAGAINGSGRLFVLSGIDPRPHPDYSILKTFVSSGSNSRVSRAVFAAAGMWCLWLVHQLCFRQIVENPLGRRYFRAADRHNPPEPVEDRRGDPSFWRSVTVTRTDRPFTRSMARWIVPYLPPLRGNNQEEDGANRWPIVPYQAVQQHHPPEDLSRAIVVYQPPLQPPVGQPPLQPPVGHPRSRLMMMAMLSMAAVSLGALLAFAYFIL